MTEQAFHEQNKIYQVSTLQALLLGYNRSVITTGELLRHGSIGLGTFENLDGINAEGWHLHFITEDRSRGGHVLDLSLTEGTVGLLKLSSLEVCLPLDPSFDTYSLHNDLQDDIRQVETGT